MHLSDDELLLYLRGQLGEVRAVELEAHSTGCADCERRLKETARFLHELSETNGSPGSLRWPNRRRELRVPIDEPAMVRLLYPPFARLSVRIADVSRNGLRLRTPTAVPPSALVQVRTANGFAMGEVRYCLDQGAEFLIGIEIHDFFPLRQETH